MSCSHTDAPSGICLDCGLVLSENQEFEDEELSNRFAPRRHDQYQQLEYIRKKVSEMNMELAEKRSVKWVEVLGEIRGMKTWSEVNGHLKKCGCQEWWIKLPMLLGHPVDFKGCLREVARVGSFGIKLAPMYLAARLLHLSGFDHRWIPVRLKSEEELRFPRWAQLCHIRGWPIRRLPNELPKDWTEVIDKAMLEAPRVRRSVGVEISEEELAERAARWEKRHGKGDDWAEHESDWSESEDEQEEE